MASINTMNYMDPTVKSIATSKPLAIYHKTKRYLAIALGKARSMLQIEWKSSLYHSNGRPRSRPKASTVHGWLVKWRATFSGNERLRKEGIREMREAKATREWKKNKKAARQGKAGVSKSFFRLWPISLGKERQPQTPKGLSRVSGHSSAKHPRHRSTLQLTSPDHSPRPTPTNSRRSSHNRQGAGGRTPRSSRKTSYDSQRSIARALEKRR